MRAHVLYVLVLFDELEQRADKCSGNGYGEAGGLRCFVACLPCALLRLPQPAVREAEVSPCTAVPTPSVAGARLAVCVDECHAT